MNTGNIQKGQEDKTNEFDIKTYIKDLFKEQKRTYKKRNSIKPEVLLRN